MNDGWNGTLARRARQRIGAQLPAPCWRCGRMLTADQPWTVGHIIDRAIAPHLAADPINWAADCPRCNYSAGASAGNRRRRVSKRLRTITPTSRRW